MSVSYIEVIMERTSSRHRSDWKTESQTDSQVVPELDTLDTKFATTEVPFAITTGMRATPMFAWWDTSSG